jgi:MoaA/NifB/PqqE/SkfB family radical SAM enzyme
MMEFSLMEKLISDCSKFLFKPRVHFSGLGEPLIYPRIRDAMALCKEKGLKWSMTTNGYVLDKYASDLIDNKCTAINVSIHGDKAQHEKVSRIKGSFNKVSSAIRKLARLKKERKVDYPLIALNCVFSNENLADLKGTLKELLKLPLNSITFQHLIFSKKDLEEKKDFLILQDEKIKILKDFVRYIKSNKFPIKINIFPQIEEKDIKGYYSDKAYPFKSSCILPWLTFRAYPNGEVSMCCQKVGNIGKSSLKEIINNKKSITFRNLIRKGKLNAPACFRCCHRHYY